jgi:cytosine/adenosine deaminase-related metal-dependent hydrolase
VELLTDHFEPDAPDSEWLRAVGERRWLILTKDRHIRSNQIEIVELMASGTACFTLTSANATGEDMAHAFVAALPVMKRFMAKFAPPFIATVSLSGAVSMLFTHSSLIKKID